MSDLIGIAILIALGFIFVQDYRATHHSKPKSQDEKFLETAHIKPWKGEK